MSSAPDPPGHDAHDAHDTFTGEPIQTLPADEPRTPGWLPLLGLALFTGAAVMFLAGREPSPEASGQAGGHPQAAGQAPAPAVPAPAVPQMATVVRPQGPPPVAPAGATAPAIQRLTPEQRAKLLKDVGNRTKPPAPTH